MRKNQVRVLSAEDDDNIFYDRTTGLHKLALLNERMYRGYDRCTCHVLDTRSRLFDKLVTPHLYYNRNMGLYDDSYLRLWQAKHARRLLANIATKRKGPSVGKDIVDDYEYFYGWLGNDYSDEEREEDRSRRMDTIFYKRTGRPLFDRYDPYSDLYEKEEQVWLQNIKKSELAEDRLYA